MLLFHSSEIDVYACDRSGRCVLPLLWTCFCSASITVVLPHDGVAEALTIDRLPDAHGAGCLVRIGGTAAGARSASSVSKGYKRHTRDATLNSFSLKRC